MSGRRITKGHRREEDLPKTQDKSALVTKANSTEPDQASSCNVRSPIINSEPGDVISAIKELKADLKGDNEKAQN